MRDSSRLPELSFNLRPAARSDFPAIRDLIRAVRINPIGLDWQRFVISEDQAGRLIGCGQIKTHGKDNQVLYELASIAVVPAWRGKGVAQAIITHLLAAHPGTLYLTCRAHMEPFYEKFGFHRLHPAGMPAYFRRISRLAQLFSRSGLISPDLLVMIRETAILFI